MEIWDIGHSNLKVDEFVDLLKANRIERIVDVRRFPSSKKFPHFEKLSLERTLKEKGIEYAWLGESLGGFRKGGYGEWMKTEEFVIGLEELERMAAEKRTAFMCAEADFRGCHRRFIIEHLEKKGWRILHISAKSKKQVPVLTSTLFSDKEP